MKALYTYLNLLIFLLYFSTAFAQKDSLNIQQKHSFFLNIGYNQWAPVIADAPDAFKQFVNKGGGLDFGLHYQRHIEKGFYYQTSINLSLIQITNALQFKRADFPDVFETDSLNPERTQSFISSLNNSSFMFSFNLGKRWLNHPIHEIRTSVGIGIAHFIINNPQMLHYENSSALPNETSLAAFNLTNVGRGVFGFSYSVPINIDYINKRYKIKWGIGLIYNLGFKPFFENDSGYVLFPKTNSYQFVRTSMKYQYTGIRFFVGI